MSRYCRICDSHKANERFTGKGHKRLICKECWKLPKEKIRCIDALRDMSRFFFQSHISEKNLKRLLEFAAYPNRKLSELATAVHTIGKLYPGKRKRAGKLLASHPDLLELIVKSRLRLPYSFYDAADMCPWAAREWAEGYRDPEEFEKELSWEEESDFDECDWFECAILAEDGETRAIVRGDIEWGE